MHLIAAEGAARANSLTTALAQLNEVRRSRYSGTPVESRNFVSNNQDEVLNAVLEERRRELSFHGLRWFDMRRLDTENRMPAVIRYNAQNTVIATLEAA